MNVISDGWRGLTLILTLNADRILTLAVLTAALGAATWLAMP